MVELQPSKLIAWVRFPSPAPEMRSKAAQAKGAAGLNGNAHVAQLAEHFLGKEEVSGSIPLMGSMCCAPASQTNYLIRRKQWARQNSREARLI